MKKIIHCTLVSLLALGLFSACVERRLRFSSNLPSNSVQIVLDGEPIGNTPTSVLFDNYGDRDWQARAEGYQTASGRVHLETPWYQWPVFDFVCEVLLPITIVDEHVVEVELRPLETKDLDSVLKRAEDFREESIKEVNKTPKIGDKKK